MGLLIGRRGSGGNGEDGEVKRREIPWCAARTPVDSVAGTTGSSKRKVVGGRGRTYMDFALWMAPLIGEPSCGQSV